MKSATFLNVKEKDKNKLLFELVERFYYEGEKIVIFTSDEDRANELDRFIWVYKQESFIPHKIFKYSEEDAPEKIAVVYEELNPITAKVLIVYDKCNLNFAVNFERIYEFVEQNRDDILESRKRYKFYKEKGFLMHYEE
ncbi:MAG: DNA polymerase III subunit chi [Proteobacteria bacterium]|nr:DNA polymerase III subunit chi [Pseudomonadota bacterium]